MIGLTTQFEGNPSAFIDECPCIRCTRWIRLPAWKRTVIELAYEFVGTEGSKCVETICCPLQPPHIDRYGVCLDEESACKALDCITQVADQEATAKLLDAATQTDANVTAIY
jgi:hypothetical protein